MNKKFLFGMFAAAGMLLATSCQNDELDLGQSGNEATVSFTLGVEGGVQTRAISDGKTANELHYAVFNENGERITGIDKVETSFSFPGEVNLTLAKGQTYKVAFWAQNSACDAYTVDDNMQVTIDYGGLNNDETRDAFFKTEEFTVTRDEEIKVVLKRPFAQLNVGVYETDWAAAVASGIEVVTSKVVIKNAATSIDLISGNVDGKTNVTYDFGKIPAQFDTEEWLEVDIDNDGTKDKYKYLSMSYFLVNAENDGAAKANLEGLEFTFGSNGNDIVFDEGLTQVPVQRNWRTNIIGKILTGDVKFNISIDPIYDGENNIIDGTEESNEIAPGVTYTKDENGKETFGVTSVEGLKWIADQTNGTITADSHVEAFFEGQTVKLAHDLDMTGLTGAWTPIGDAFANSFKGTFDGGNYTIANLKVNHANESGLFGNIIGTVKNVKLTNVTVTGNWKAGALAASVYGTIDNCHVDGGSVKSTVVNEDNANNVGGLVGFLAEGNNVVTNCSAKNLSVTAYRDLGGLVGTAQSGSSVTNSIVDNVDVTANQLVTYVEQKDANAGEVVGRNLGATVNGNEANNVTITVLKVDDQNIIKVGSAEEFLAIVSNAAYTGDRGTALAGKTIQLTNDLDFSQTTNSYPQFYLDHAGNFTFDGDGHTIRNFSHADSDRAAFFRTVGNNFTIKNITFEDAHIYSANGTCHGKQSAVVIGLVEKSDGIFKNVTVKDSKLDIGYGVGAFIGVVKGAQGDNANVTFEDCKVENTEILGSFRVGGFVGYKDAGSVITITNSTIDDKTVIKHPVTPFDKGNSYVDSYEDIEVTVNGVATVCKYAKRGTSYQIAEGKYYTTEGTATAADGTDMKYYAVNE